ncbi:MAG: OsmC family protein [Bacteroidota bacterium]|nr:OsmC family protein [Bacteroidota bacterium]
MVRTATATWLGSGKEGNGKLQTQSGVLQDHQYSYNTRFEDGVGTNPEELIAAAHAGCFSMKLSFVLVAAGFTPESITANCSITLESGSITESHLDVTATVPGIDEAQFEKCLQEAKVTCPVSKLLNATITASGTLA